MKIKMAVLLFFCCCSHSQSMAVESCELVNSVDFNNHSDDFVTYSQLMAANDFGHLNHVASGEVRGLDRPDKVWPARNKVGQGVLRAHYPSNTAGGKNTGFLFDQQFKQTEEAVMEYRVKFSENFHWASGGKLPGLGGHVDGVNVPVGCTKNNDSITNGFSARLMWRKEGRLVAYTYFPNRLIPDHRKSNCGIDIPITKLKDNQWYKIRQHIRLNTPGIKNGYLGVYINGELKLEVTDVEYRLAGKDDLKINDIIFHTYRGGKEKDSRFHSPIDEYVDFDDFKVWRNCSL